MNEIIADIYHAAAGTKTWVAALTKITQALGLVSCQIVGFSTPQGAALFSHASAESPSEAELEYVRTYHRVDPRFPLVLAGQDGEWLYDEDVFSADRSLTDPYYRDLLIPYGYRHSATTKLYDRDGELIVIGFLSLLGDDGFTAGRRQILEAIAFHLCEAAAIYQKTRKLSASAFMGSELLQRIPRPAMLLGVDRSMTFMNDKAKQYVAERGSLFMVRDRLTALDKKTDERLTTAFSQIDEEVLKGGLPRRRVARLGTRDGSPYAAFSLIPFVPSLSMYAFGLQLQVLLIVHEHSIKAEPDVMLWEAAYELTPSQSRVALELFRGTTLPSIAKTLKIAQTTVKSHLKDLYKKTGTSRQAELVSALASLQSA